MTKIFRNSQNQRYLNGLFFETSTDKSTVVYTLKDVDHLGFPSLYRIYMEMEDPTEYDFAIANLDGYEHWEILTRCSWFKATVDRWRKELALKLKSRALKAIQIEAADPDSKNNFQANKYLLEQGWEDDKVSKKRGRPSKSEIQARTQEEIDSSSRVSQDLKRLSLHN